MTYIAAYLLGIISFGVFMIATLMRIHKTPPPTFHRRRWRDAPGTEFHEVPATVKWEAKATADERGVNYSFMGTTGLEE